MLIVLSPAKSLDYETPVTPPLTTQPAFLDDAAQLISVLRDLAPHDIAALMDLSDKLAQLNFERYQSWTRAHAEPSARAAVLAFDGDVYDGLAARQLGADELHFAQDHLRLLSGLYGVLRPLDLLLPYRLEMGTRLATPAGKDLYAFWGERIARALGAAMPAGEAPVLVNLASEEYFKAVRRQTLGCRVVTPVFEEWKGGRYKIISFYAKWARGAMARYAIERRITDPQQLRGFDVAGYRLAEAASDGDTWVFRRRLDA